MPTVRWSGVCAEAAQGRISPRASSAAARRSVCLFIGYVLSLALPGNAAAEGGGPSEGLFPPGTVQSPGSMPV